MGRGDKRTEKGKRFKGSHGNTRPKNPGRKRKSQPVAKKAAPKK